MKMEKDMNMIPASHSDLLKDDVRAFHYLGTQMTVVSPQVNPVWFNTSGDFVLLNSAI
jgi:hypothetical protein